MDNKKTIMLTIIAVVTLLTAVVGATFAYFTFNATISSSTNTITATTGSVGNVTLTATTPALHITTDAYDFRQNSSALTYWATSTSSNYKSTEEVNVINTLAVSGGSASTIYECTYTLEINTQNLPSGIRSGEYVLYITGIDNIELDMYYDSGATYTVTRYITGPQSETISASAKLVNTTSAQNYLQNKTITTTFTTSDLHCETVATAGTDSMSLPSD